MIKSVVGLFDKAADARAALHDLQNAGFAKDKISFVANNQSGEYTQDSRQGGNQVAEGTTRGTVSGSANGPMLGLRLMTLPGIGSIAASGGLAGVGTNTPAGGLVGTLVDAGIPRDDANLYTEGVRRDGSLVLIQTDTDKETKQALKILNRRHVIDIDERAQLYRKEGWTRFDATANEYSSPAMTMNGTHGGDADDHLAVAGSSLSTAREAVATTPSMARGADGSSTQTRSTGNVKVFPSTFPAPVSASSGETMHARENTAPARVANVDTNSMPRANEVQNNELHVPVVAEELIVGKRQVDGGGVRVHTHVETIPVEQQVRLRHEHIEVQRYPINQIIDTPDAHFQEGTVELRETIEEAVVNKRARIVEEVVVRKHVEERTETVHDAVRRTAVGIEQLPGASHSILDDTTTSPTNATETTGVRRGITQRLDDAASQNRSHEREVGGSTSS